MSLVQRFGSVLNLNIHFHLLMLDGATPGAMGIPSGLPGEGRPAGAARSDTEDPRRPGVGRRTDVPEGDDQYRPTLNIPAAISANKQGLIGVKVTLGSGGRIVEVPMGFERYGRLNLQELKIHLRNALVLMSVNGTMSAEPTAFQLPDAQ